MIVETGSVVFGCLDAPELVEARTEVIEWAEELYLDQRETWRTRKRKGRRNKPTAPSLRRCLDESRKIRLKRERDHTYWNQLTATNPTR